MKILIYIACFVFAHNFVFAQGECIVQGKVKGLEDGTCLVFYRPEGRLLNVLMTDTVRNERFCFKIPLEKSEPECLYLIATGEGFPNGWLEIWVEPGKKVMVDGDDKLLGSWRVKSKIREQQDQNRYVNATYDLLRAELRLRLAQEEITRSKKMAQAERKKAWQELDGQIDSIRVLITAKMIGIMKKSSIGPVWLDKLHRLALSCRYSKTEFPWRRETEELYTRLSEEQKQSEFGKNIAVNLFPPVVVKVGDQAADADLFDLEGKVHHLADYRGRLVLLDFWSRGCGPCMMALPELRKLAETNKERLTIVSLSTDNKKNWEEVSAKEKMSWENLNDLQGESGLYAKYGVNGIPHYVVISPEGKIVHTWNGYGQGIIEMHLNRFLDRSHCVMSVNRLDNGGKVVKFPDIQPGGTNTLAIDKVVLSDTATVVYMKAYYMPHYWIMISSDSYLLGNDGTRSSLVKAEGIAPGKQFVMPADGKASFVLTFGPLPAGIKSFDFIEGHREDCFKVLGVALE